MRRIPEETLGSTKPLFRRTAAYTHRRRRLPARRAGLRKRCTARRGAGMRGLDMQGKMGCAEDSWVCRFGGLGTTGLKTLRGGRKSLVNSSIALITAVGQLLTREFKPPPAARAASSSGVVVIVWCVWCPLNCDHRVDTPLRSERTESLALQRNAGENHARVGSITYFWSADTRSVAQ